MFFCFGAFFSTESEKSDFWERGELEEEGVWGWRDGEIFFWGGI